ncbi:hypothetical protein HRR83_000445 [Exophiala dermatitidis]|nr:hypothetical protein HRR74_000447 [Exophiala dermatitidis]KAJ4528328.1 hypothetical protein HRR73_000951 [Exophiala dermatitidis]KAJ4581524.1 hypothetical protein HRR79_000550 [Exophiala dermatitidis]KAJ4584744.1 hypothetical protein HRR81_000550 [Exophiala dermatitidis]KAJ4607229.1 hypothetical protein HRR84_000533 [Exophiala dermatitidis]
MPLFQVPEPYLKQDGVVSWAPEGDTFIRVIPNGLLPISPNIETFRVSSSALTQRSSYFSALLGPRWNTSDNGTGKSRYSPLILQGDSLYGIAMFLALAHDIDLSSQETNFTFRNIKIIARVCDKYMYSGPTPSYITNPLNKLLSIRPSRLMYHHEGSAMYCLPDIMVVASILNLSEILTKASRHMMWVLPVPPVGGFDAECTMTDLFRPNFVRNFREEAERLSKHLVTQLPKLLWPDPHSSTHTGRWWCENCAAITHEERWNRELISKCPLDDSSIFLMSLGDIVSTWLNEIPSLDDAQHSPGGGPREELPCGRFRLRYADISLEEIHMDLYASMGGMCMHCYKAGVFRYDVFCQTHKMCLVLN